MPTSRKFAAVAWSALGRGAGRCFRTASRSLRGLHRNERGTISIVSVFAVLALTMVFGMVMNVGRQVDGKIRMQNAADASAYSGGVTLARGMNTLAFTNHLLCDVCSMTAFMREARDKNAASYAPGVLAAWTNVAPKFTASQVPKFKALGPAIEQKVPLEKQMVDSYTTWAEAVSAQVLPLMEEILAQEMIPQYQRAVVATFPEISQLAAMEVAKRNGQPNLGRGPMLGAMWRTDGMPVGADELYHPTLPVVDPTFSSDQTYMDQARNQRRNYANRYLRAWNNETMAAFDYFGKMSQFGQFWRSFTCGQLAKLLDEEYPDTNLPMQILRESSQPDRQDALMFVGVVYWKALPEMMPGLFHNTLSSDSQAYAQVRLFIARRRLEWHWHGTGGGGGGGPGGIPIGGVPGDIATIPPDNPTPPPSGGGGGGGGGRWDVGRQGVPTNWDLINQSWTCQLVPATGPNLTTILQSTPPLPEFGGSGLRLPALGGVGDRDIQNISPH